MTEHNRREFVFRTLYGGLSLATSASTVAGASGDTTPGATFCAFTESFQDWPIPKVCKRFSEIGLDGLDLTLRPGGHIEPENATKELPLAAQAAEEVGLKISMLTTAIVQSDRQAEEILSVAGHLGIPRVKLGYYRYNGFGNLREQIDETKNLVEGVVRIARKHGVLPCIHIHSGKTIPSGGPVSYLLFRDFSPDELGAYVDPMHMTLEGGVDGWRQGLDLLAPWITITSMKNCKWTAVGRDTAGQQRWEPRKCPVEDGVAPIPDFIATLKQIGFRGLYTMHSEYKDRNSWKLLTTEECLEQTHADLSYAKRLVAS